MKHALALLISGLFNDAVTIADYTVSERSWYVLSEHFPGRPKQILTGTNVIPRMETANGRVQLKCDGTR
jgi:hypothetical protein